MSDLIVYQAALNTIQNRPMTPQTLGISQASAVSGTWYTVLSVASGSGFLLAVAGRGDTTTGGGRFTRFRITVDGNPSQIVGDATHNYIFGGAPVDSGTGTILTGFVCVPFVPGVRFKTSLLVEAANFNGTVTLKADATYVLVS